jgi:hypothetical protein
VGHRSVLIALLVLVGALFVPPSQATGAVEHVAQALIQFHGSCDVEGFIRIDNLSSRDALPIDERAHFSPRHYLLAGSQMLGGAGDRFRVRLLDQDHASVLYEAVFDTLLPLGSGDDVMLVDFLDCSSDPFRRLTAEPGAALPPSSVAPSRGIIDGSLIAIIAFHGACASTGNVEVENMSLRPRAIDVQEPVRWSQQRELRVGGVMVANPGDRVVVRLLTADRQTVFYETDALVATGTRREYNLRLVADVDCSSIPYQVIPDTSMPDRLRRLPEVALNLLSLSAVFLLARQLRNTGTR